MTAYKTNDLKSGDRVKLRNGWEAIIRDNKRGNYRYAEVFGTWHETGEIYAYDIVGTLRDNIWYPVVLTKAQTALFNKTRGA
jgi:hypothetical protein